MDSSPFGNLKSNAKYSIERLEKASKRKENKMIANGKYQNIKHKIAMFRAVLYNFLF